MRRLIIVEWETGPESGTDEEACARLELIGHELMGFLVGSGYVDPAVSMEPSTLHDALQYYVDHPSFSLDAGKRARTAMGL